jgi:hypothetical protein
MYLVRWNDITTGEGDDADDDDDDVADAHKL